MKFPVKTVLIVGTLFALVAGFFMPRLFFAYQDSSIPSQIREYETNPVKLEAHAADLAETLRISARGSNPISVREGNNLDAGQAEAFAREFLDGFEESFLLEIMGANPIAEAIFPTIVVDEAEGSGSALVWECIFIVEEPFSAIVTLGIDDQTGKMVKITYDQHVINQQFSEEEYLVRAEAFVEACKEYYPLSGENLKPSAGNEFERSGTSFEFIGVYAYDNEVGFDITCSAYTNRTASTPDQTDIISVDEAAGGRAPSFDIFFSLAPVEVSS